MSFDYNLRITVGVCLREDQVRDPETEEFKDFVIESEEDGCYQLLIQHPSGPRLLLEDTGEGDRVYYLGYHTYGSDWRRNPEEVFLSPEDLALAEIEELVRETLEPLGLWAPGDFGVYVWASIS